jgi:hypothetical protein
MLRGMGEVFVGLLAEEEIPRVNTEESYLMRNSALAVLLFPAASCTTPVLMRTDTSAGSRVGVMVATYTSPAATSTRSDALPFVTVMSSGSKPNTSSLKVIRMLKGERAVRIDSAEVIFTVGALRSSGGLSLFDPQLGIINKIKQKYTNEQKLRLDRFSNIG